ncbi:sodium:solute symporter [Planctomycetota bacterium]
MIGAIGFESWDWFTLGLFFLGLLAIVWWVLKQKEETSADYFLAGRKAGWIAIGASIFASNIGSEHLVGLAGAGAKTGMAMAHWEIHAWLILVLGWVFVPFYARSMVYTMPEFLEKRYCSGARMVLSIISLVSYVLTKVAVTVWAGGTVFKTVLGIETLRLGSVSIDFFWVGAIGLVVITGIYTVIGGMKSVLYTSILQTPVLLIGSIVILFVGLSKLGGWGELQLICSQSTTDYGDNMMSLIRSAKDPQFPWTGVLLGSAIIGFWYWCTDQYIVQRALSAPNQKEARRGTIFAGYLKLLPVFIFLIPGMIAFALAQKNIIQLDDPDRAFPVLVTQLLPAGIKGIVVGGLTAALMSSLASLFNSSATLFTVDFYKKFKKYTTEKELVFVGRIATAVVVVLGIAWIPVMRGLGQVLYEYLQDVQSLLAPGIAAVFVLGVFSKRTSAAGGLWGLTIGFVLGISRLVLKVVCKAFDSSGEILNEWVTKRVMNPDLSSMQQLIVKFVGINWLHYCIFLFFLILLICYVISLFTKKPNLEKIQGLTFGSATPEQIKETRNSYNKWDIIHSLTILGAVIAFYIYFW